MTRTAIGGGYIHHALFFGSDDELLAAAVPFLQMELAPDEAAVLVCDDHNNALLAAALGDHPNLDFLPRADVYVHTATAVAAYRGMMEDYLAAGVRRVRLVGEVDFGPEETTWAEWSRFEAIVNVGLAPYPLSSVCAYNTRTLPEPVLAAGRATHPNMLARGGRRVPNDAYRDPDSFLRRYVPAPADPREPADSREPAGPVFRTEIRAVTDLRRLRTEVTSTLAAFVNGGPALSEFVLAIYEVAANGLQHGRPPVRVRAWAEPGRLVCTVTDRGEGFDDPLAGYHPPDRTDIEHSRLGLWAARQICDHVDMATTPDGFTVRLERCRRGRPTDIG